MKVEHLIPMLPVASLAANIDFHSKLGFSVERREDGWGWAMLRFDECRVIPNAPRLLGGGAPRPRSPRREPRLEKARRGATLPGPSE